MTAYFLNKQVFYGSNLPYVSLLLFQAGPRPSTVCFPRGSALRVRLVTGLSPGDQELPGGRDPLAHFCVGRARACTDLVPEEQMG